MEWHSIAKAGEVDLLYNVTGLKEPHSWLQENRNEIDQYLNSNGALLLRGIDIKSPADFSDILNILFEEKLLNYVYRSTPRTEMHKNIYTATEYPSSETIPQHNENAYSSSWPMRIAFWCSCKAEKNGNTPICDSRTVYRLMPADIREEFERKEVMYVRNYADVDLPWSEVFQTDDKNEVEKFCKDNRIDFEWTDGGLRTKQVCQATAIHPATGTKLWFNQAHLFHVSSLNNDVREGLIELLGEENLPRNAYFGDGSPIPYDILQQIRKIYEENLFCFDWEDGDLLLLDNMLYSHGRQPFEGKRKVLVGMARGTSAGGR